MAVGLNTSEEKALETYRKRYAALKNERNPYIALWRDIRNFLAPRTARFHGEKDHDATRQDLDIINTHPRYAVRTLPAGMQSGVTSPLRPWFRLGTPDPDLENFKPVKIYLYEVERIMRLIMARSNLYDRLKSNYGILGTYGTSSFFLEEDDEDVIRAFDFPMGSFCISNDSRGRVDTLYREVTMNVLNLVNKFGKNVMPFHIQTAYDNGDYENRHKLIHILEPNANYRPGSALNQHKRFASVWYLEEESHKRFLRRSGYDYTPHMAPRWDLVGEDKWGVGCGEYAIGDAKQLQIGEKRALQILDKVANPTMVGDASLRNKRTTVLPGDTTYVNGLITGNQGYRPAYQIQSPPLDLVEAKQRMVEQRIDEAFYKNLFLMVAEIGDQPNITATQINTMREEKLMMLGPVLERLNDELLDPLIDTVFMIAQKRGLLPPPPEEIQGMPLRVEYISVLAQAQKAMGIGNIERFVGFVGQMAQFDPTALNKLNTFETIDEYGDGVAVPPKIIRTNDEAQAMTQQQQQQQQAAAGLDTASTMADVMQKASQTDLEGDSALTRALETAGAQ